MKNPIQFLHSNMQDLIRLFEFFEKNTGSNISHPINNDVLNKSSIVFITACWEAFNEETVSLAFSFILDHLDSHTDLPETLLRRIALHIRDVQDEIKLWDLAGEGWKKVLLDYKDSMIQKHIGLINTPTAENIDHLCKVVLDLDQLSKNWYWRGMYNRDAKAQLNEYIRLGGSITHRTRNSRIVTRKEVDEYVSLVLHIAVKTNNTMRNHVHKIVGKSPWIRRRSDTITS